MRKIRYTEVNLARIFVLRLEKGDRIPDSIEKFADDQGIQSAIVFFIGGADGGSRVVVGPQDGGAVKPIPVLTQLEGASESIGLGTIFLNEEQQPKLHLHGAFGRGTQTITGCTRQGVNIWLYGEVVIQELAGGGAFRETDPQTGFQLLEINEGKAFLK